jgi:SAM-dependent methyltransferase
VDYRRLIAWPERIRREWPFLERVLGGGPSRRVLDLGCGTGEHGRELAAHGFDVTGVDSSPSMLASAADRPLPPSLRFVQSDIADVGALDGPFGGAICLGNTLPHLDEGGLRRLARGLAAVLLPGAPVIVQILNYERIRSRNIRYLPLNFREEAEGEEVVFLRLMRTGPDGTVVFTPTTLRYRPGGDPPVEVLHTRSVTLRGWTWVEVRDAFDAAGFERFEPYGGYDASPFSASDSTDLVAVFRR